MSSILFSDLEFHKKIGQGSFGKVWQGSYLGTPVAIKQCLPTEGDSDFDFIKYFEREADLLSKSRHPNIVQFLGTCVDNNNFYIVTEYVPCGTMKSWIITDKVNSIKARLSFAIDIARALTYLHSCNIIHRDLKPSNLLITENQRIKVCDFGFARLIAYSEEEKRRMTFCGTDEYMAPELLQGLTFDKSADIFGFGVILCELASLQMAGSRVFKRVVPGYHIYPSEIEDRATSNCPKELVALAIKCTLPEPKERPTMLEVLNVLHVLEKATSSLGFIHVGIHGLDMTTSDSLPSLLNNISIPDGNLSIHLQENEKNELCTPNLILDSSQISSEPSPYSKYSDIHISHSECSQKMIDSSQEFSSTKNVLLNSLSLSTSKLPSLLQSPLQNLLISESNITLGRTAIPKIDSSYCVANFSSIGFSKIRHEGLGLELIDHISDDKNLGYGHRFSIQSVNGLDTCKYCQQKLSDFLKTTYGMVCDDCGLICHKRCASLAPYNCDAPSPALKSLASLFTQNSVIKSSTAYS